MWNYAHRKGRRRAIRVAVLAPVAIFEVLPKNFPHLHSLVGIGRIAVQIASVVEELIGDARGWRRGDPIVICGKLPPKKPLDSYEEFAAILSDSRLAFTFGYELAIDVKWAARMARNGSLKEAPDLIGSDKIVRSTRHVCRKMVAGEEVILLCNSAGTALAVESEIPDPALAGVLRKTLASEGEADGGTTSHDGIGQGAADQG